jgi:TolB-like protein/KaiC/GvpD/RAD55 family RecA-like ATPase/tetratricopeptide (TPR) repeat protein
VERVVLASLEGDRVPPARPVPTGYVDLDKLLYGGLPPNLAVALTSPACNERDLLVKDFLETGARNGEVTFYVTIDPGAAKLFAEEFPSNFHIFVCNPQADAIVKDAPNVAKLKGVENLTDVSMALTSAIRKLDPSLKAPRRICLGIVSDVLLQHHAVHTRRWLTSLLAELKSTGFTTLAVIDPQMHTSEELHAILGLFDGDISIYEKETDNGLREYLRIKKMGNSKYLEDELQLAHAVPKVKPQESKTVEAVLDKHRIAVLPFVNMSPDPADEYFADGMTEEIISTVSGISGLRVISRTSIMRYKKTEKAVKEIGRELEVGSVLEGSFRKAGNRIRVTTQLIDVADDEHLWAQNYDRNLDDVFAVQSDVAKQVAEALRVRILSSEKERVERKPTESTAAYTLYLKGRSLWNKRGPQELKKAMEYFELAVHEDPSFALGYAGQADCAILLRTNWDIDREENLAKAKAMAERALQLDPALAEAHATLGFVFLGEFDLRRAEEEFMRAIELKPSYAMAHQWYFRVLCSELTWDEALWEIEKAVELDPLSGIIITNLGDYYSARRDWQRAAEKFKIAIELGQESAHRRLAQAYGMMKMYDKMEKEAEIWARYIHEVAPGIRTYIDAYSAYFKGDKETVRRLLPELEASPKETFMTAYGIACFHFFLGDVDKGFEWLEQAYSRREFLLLYIQSDWDLDGVRTDPRYLDLLKRLGLGRAKLQPTS